MSINFRCRSALAATATGDMSEGKLQFTVHSIGSCGAYSAHPTGNRIRFGRACLGERTHGEGTAVCVKPGVPVLLLPLPLDTRVHIQWA